MMMVIVIFLLRLNMLGNMYSLTLVIVANFFESVHLDKAKKKIKENVVALSSFMWVH